MSTQRTIYLNHAGTSWPKPEPVLDAANAVFHLEPDRWPELFQESHQTIASFFHVDPTRLLLTPSCTAALNSAVLDHDWKPGDRLITSHYEHHALHRTTVKLSERGVNITILPNGGDELIDLEALGNELKAGPVKLLALTAACNVTGELLPIRDAIKLAHEVGTMVLIDGAQIAGWWDLNVTDLGADLFTFAGHKGPQAPWGIGGLYVTPDILMHSPKAVCEGPTFEEPTQCAIMPGYCDVGSVNLNAMAGMAAGCRWLNEPEQQERLTHARALADELTNSFRELPHVKIHGDVPMNRKMPTVAITIDNALSTEVAAKLRERGVIASGGFQCAPQAHSALGTDEQGVVRFSVGPQAQASEMEQAIGILQVWTGFSCTE